MNTNSANQANTTNFNCFACAVRDGVLGERRRIWSLRPNHNQNGEKSRNHCDGENPASKSKLHPLESQQAGSWRGAYCKEFWSPSAHDATRCHGGLKAPDRPAGSSADSGRFSASLTSSIRLMASCVRGYDGGAKEIHLRESVTRLPDHVCHRFDGAAPRSPVQPANPIRDTPQGAWVCHP